VVQGKTGVCITDDIGRLNIEGRGKALKEIILSMHVYHGRFYLIFTNPLVIFIFNSYRMFDVFIDAVHLMVL
jgi:hypothetical protein